MSVSSAQPVPFSLSVQKLTVAKWIGYFALIDLLFFPYFQLIIIPFSLPLLLLAPVVVDMKIRKDRYFFFFLAFALPIVLSAGLSFFIPDSLDSVTENVKRTIQLLSSFVYYFYFRWLAAAVPLRISPIIWLFLAWFALLGAMFVANPIETQAFIRAVYGRLVTPDEVVTAHLRFAYMFADPNTGAYFFLVATSVLLLKNRTFLPLTLIAAILFVVTFVTQSSGAIIALVLMLATSLYPPSMLLRSLMNVRKAIGLVVICLVASGVFIYVSNVGESNTVLKLAFDRLFESSDRYASGGSRFEIWERFFDTLLPLPLGRGYVLSVEGGFHRPHSDLLRVVYSYGLFALVPMVALLFGRLMSLAPLIIPALMAFLINSLLDEQKLLALFLSLLAIYMTAGSHQSSRTSSVPGH